MSLFTNLQSSNALQQLAALNAHGRAFSAIVDSSIASLNDLNVVHQLFKPLSAIHKSRHVTADHVKVSESNTMGMMDML